MPTQPYYVNGKRVPGVTTVIGSNLGWNKDPLMYWAWKQGCDGLDFRTTKEKAANAGTIAHDMIEFDLKGESVVKATKGKDPELVRLAQKSYSNFLNWKKTVKFEVVGLEVALVSKDGRFGGCIDCIARVNGELALFDWKTSGSIHEDYLLQLAAYVELWNENHPEDPIIGGIYLLRIDKESGSWSWSHWDELVIKDDLGNPIEIFQVFMFLRKLHSVKYSLKRLIG